MVDEPREQEPGEEAEALAPETEAEERRSRRSRLRSFALGSLTRRIVLLNLIGLMILMGGILYFNKLRQGLIDARVQSLTTQAQIIAAAIAGSASADTGSIVINPDSLDDGGEGAGATDSQSSLDFPIDPEKTGPVLRRLLANTNVRARIIDTGGNLMVDSRFLYGGSDIAQSDLPAAADQGPDLWTRILDWIFASDYPLQKEYGLDNGRDFPEVAAALNGASVSIVRLNAQNEIIVLVAVPVQRFRAVLGALVLSTKGGEIDNVLRAERRVALMTYGLVSLVTLLLSLLIAYTIANPIRRLADAADRVRRGINKRVEIPDFSGRRDEIGHLSAALRDMTNALYNRIDAIEAFAADVAHELKNPLTSLRSAVETIGLVKTDEQRARLIAVVKDDVKRLDRLITDISDSSRLDAELARAEAAPVDVLKLLSAITSLANEMKKNGEPAITLVTQPGRNAASDWLVAGHDSRLGQVFRNLIDNARSFAPGDSQIHVRLRRQGRTIDVRVEDQGPGIPPENLERVFERFYTDRPEASFGKNSGLGLSISRQIVEAHKGRIWAENREGKANAEGLRPVLGARFVVSLPALLARPAGGRR